MAASAAHDLIETFAPNMTLWISRQRVISSSLSPNFNQNPYTGPKLLHRGVVDVSSDYIVQNYTISNYYMYY